MTLDWFDSLVHATADGIWLGTRRYDATPNRLITELDRVGSWRACLVGIAGHTDNDFILELTRTYPDRFIPVAGVDPTTFTDDPKPHMRQLARQGFRGIKLHSRLNGYDPLDERALATIVGAGDAGMAVFVDTLFRNRDRATAHPADIIDRLAIASASVDHPTPLVLLHGGGAHLLELFELGRAHAHLLIDLAFTINRYAGSSLDDDIGFMCEQLDQRITVGSDMPEYTPTQALERFLTLTTSLPPEKLCNILYANLERAFGPGTAVPSAPSLPPDHG